MKVHNVIQGTPEWLALRASHFTASEAPAMMGCSPYQSRNQLLHQKHTGLTQEVSDATQRIFDDGHDTEAAFRPIAEDLIGDDLYPVTGSIELADDYGTLRLLASFDGLTMDYATGYEHKLLSAANVKAIDKTGEPPIYHCWQMEHQLLVSGAGAILFATSNGTEEGSRHCMYRSKPERRAALIAGWKQFAQDLAAYVPPPAEDQKPVGKAPETLPALRIEVTGAVTASNLAEFKETALFAIRSVNRTLETDQDFADAEKSVKWCEEVETRLKAAKEHALSQTQSIDALFKTIDDISAEARKVRLELDKLVKARKEELRGQIVSEAQIKLTEHISALQDKRIGLRISINVDADFAGAVKGKRSIDSIRNAVDTELARCKIAANEISDRIEANIKTLINDVDDWRFLFPDVAQVASKPAEDFANLFAARVAKYKQDQDLARQRALQLEQERQARDDQATQQAQARAVMATKESPASAAPANTSAPTPGHKLVRLGEINARIYPLSITADGLAALGFEPKQTEKNAKLYADADFAAMCSAIISHVQGAMSPVNY